MILTSPVTILLVFTPSFKYKKPSSSIFSIIPEIVELPLYISEISAFSPISFVLANQSCFICEIFPSSGNLKQSTIFSNKLADAIGSSTIFILLSKKATVVNGLPAVDNLTKADVYKNIE